MNFRHRFIQKAIPSFQFPASKKHQSLFLGDCQRNVVAVQIDVQMIVGIPSLGPDLRMCKIHQVERGQVHKATFAADGWLDQLFVLVQYLWIHDRYPEVHGMKIVRAWIEEVADPGLLNAKGNALFQFKPDHIHAFPVVRRRRFKIDLERKRGPILQQQTDFRRPIPVPGPDFFQGRRDRFPFHHVWLKRIDLNGVRR